MTDKELDDLEARRKAFLWADSADEKMGASLADAIAELRKEKAELEGALRWYEQQVGDCRKIHHEGEAARNALAKDGGERARTALKGKETS